MFELLVPLRVRTDRLGADWVLSLEHERGVTQGMKGECQ
jgi:hypothetical protein